MKNKLESDINNDIKMKKAKSDMDVIDQVKSIKLELKEEESVFGALQEFLKIISSEENGAQSVEEYLRLSPDCKDLFTPLVADKKSCRNLALVWNIVEKILNILSERNDVTLGDYVNTTGHSIVCNILHNHLDILYSSLSNIPKMKVATSVLKCMASMLSQGIQTVREFIKCFEFASCFKYLKECARISKKQKHDEDARSCFVRFYLAFLVFGDVVVIKKLLEQKDLSSLLMVELHLDKVENILIILETIDNKIVNEANLLKTTKLLFFTQTVLLKLIFLVKHNNENIKTQAMKLLVTLCTDQKYGICFQPKDGVYTGKLVNPVLLKLLTTVKQSALTREEIRNLTIETLHACPDAIVPYMNNLNLGLDPRLSDFWCTRLTFLTNLWEGIPNIKEICRPQNGAIIPIKCRNKDIIMKLTMPHNVTRQLFTQGMKNKVNRVKQSTLQLLEISLRRCVELRNMLEENLKREECKTNKSEVTEWIDSMICMLPDVTPVIGIRQMAALTIDTFAQDDDEVDQGEVLYDPIEMDILLDLSIQCLNQYQILKPGILTLSGFNICKMLIFSRPPTEDIMSRSLQILLNETGVHMWLKKKMSGPDNIFHIILKVMLLWKKSEEIVSSSKRLFFKVLNVMGQFTNHEFEIDLWIAKFLSSIDNSNIDVKVLVEEFAGACIKTVNEPFMYLENISSLFKKQNSVNDHSDKAEFKLPSPLFFAVLRNMAFETVITYTIIPVMKELVITHDSPGLFMEILLQEIRDDCLGYYNEFLLYSFQWVQGLGLDVSFTDANQFKDQQQEFLHQEGSTVINNIALELLKMKFGDNDPKGVESSLSMITSLMERLNLFCVECPVSSVGAISIFITNVIHFLFNSNSLISSCNSLIALFNMIESSVRILLTRGIDIKCSKCFIFNIFAVPIFKDIVNIQWNNWRVFSQNIYIILLECCSEFRSMEILKSCVDNLICAIVTKSTVIANEAVEIFGTFSVYLDKKMLCEIAEEIAVSFLRCKEQLCDASLINYLQVLQRIKNIGLDIALKLQSCDINNFLHKSITCQNNHMMNLILNIVSLSEFDSDMHISQKDYQDLLKLDKAFVNCAIFMSRRNIQIVKIGTVNTPACFTEEFINDVKNGNIPTSILVTNLLPLLVDVFKFNSGCENLSKFASKLKSLLWGIIKEEIGSRKNVVVLQLLALLLPYTSDDEKMELLSKMKFVFKNESLADVETMFTFCAKALSLLCDEKKEKLCLLELISAVMETVIDVNLAEDLYIVFIKNLLCFVQMLKVETKLKSHHYVPLGNIWIKFAKKILKSKYSDHLSMSVVLECTNIFYVDKQFIKKNTFKLKDLNQLVVSHSQFFDVLFAEDEKMVRNKVVLIKLISSIGGLSNIHEPALVPMLLVAYEAKMSEKDCLILSILCKFEKNEIPLTQFYPFVWGNNAFSVYKEQDLKSSLFKERTSAQVLQNVNKQRMEKSAIEFPIYLKLGNPDEIKLCEENYDPLFFLPLFASLLKPECVVDCYHFMESGCLSFTFAALSSFDMSIRKLAYSILTLYNGHLDSARFREKSQITYLLMLLKHSVEKEYMKFPSIWTSYCIQYIKFILKPDHHLYTVLNNALLQKPIINVKELPVFFSLFSSYHVEHTIERGWLLKLLADGLKDLSDYYLYKKYHVFELLLAFYESHICDKKMKLLIHDVFVAACSLSTAVFDLVKTNSILLWIHTNIKVNSITSKSPFYHLLYTITVTFEESCSRHLDVSDGKGINIIPKLLLHEIALICEHGLQNINTLDYKDRVYICCVYSWVQSTTNYFGDMDMWQQDCIQVQYFDILTNLLLNTQSEDDGDKISKIFCNVVLTLLEKDMASLENKCWGKIYHFSKERKMTNLIELFEKVIQWCNKTENKTFCVKLLHAIE